MVENTPERFVPENPEVLYTRAALTTVDRADVELFKRLASENARKRVRLCAHNGPEDALHEMLIIHERSCYVRPHKHLGKTESMHVVEGLVDLVVLDDVGRVDSVIPMGDYASGRAFYYRMKDAYFHTLIIRSDVLVFHETTNGPFDREDTVLAPWSPEGDDPEAVKKYMIELDNKVSGFHSRA